MLHRWFKAALVTLVAAGVAALLQGGAKADSAAPSQGSSNLGSPVTVSNTTSDVNKAPGQNSGTSVTVEQSATSSVSGSSPSVSPGSGTPPADSGTANPSADTNSGNLVGDNQTSTGSGSDPGIMQTDKPGANQPAASGDQASPPADASPAAATQPASNQPEWNPSASNDAVARPMIMTQTGSAPTDNPAPIDNGSAPTKQPTDKLPLSDGGFFSAWLKPMLATPSGAGGARAAAVYSLLSVLRAPVKVLAVLMLVSTFFLLWLRRSGYSHAARSDMVTFNFATPKRRVTVGVFAVGNSYFCGVRNKNLTNVWQGRR